MRVSSKVELPIASLRGVSPQTWPSNAQACPTLSQIIWECFPSAGWRQIWTRSSNAPKHSGRAGRRSSAEIGSAALPIERIELSRGKETPLLGIQSKTTSCVLDVDADRLVSRVELLRVHGRRERLCTVRPVTWGAEADPQTNAYPAGAMSVPEDPGSESKSVRGVRHEESGISTRSGREE